MFSKLIWKVKRFFRKLFRREWKHTQQDLTVSFLETALKLAIRGRVEVQTPTRQGFVENLDDPEVYMYFLIFRSRRFKKPRKLKDKGWFDHYTFGNDKGK